MGQSWTVATGSAAWTGNIHGAVSVSVLVIKKVLANGLKS